MTDQTFMQLQEQWMEHNFLYQRWAVDQAQYQEEKQSKLLREKVHL